MHPWLIEQRVNEHRRDRQRQAANAALVRTARQAQRRQRRPSTPMLSLGGRLGVLLIRAGGRLAAQRRPEPAPCPWCDLAFPRC